LPSGAASVRSVLIVAIALAVIALALCLAVTPRTCFVGVVLLAAILFYNLWIKKIGILGPLNRGLCRGLSSLLGATAGIQELYGGAVGVWSNLMTLAILAAMGETLYIAAITHLARIETQADPPALPRFLPFVGLIVVILPFFIAAIDRSQPLGSTNIWLYLIAAYTIYAGYKIHHRLMQEPAPPIPPTIGQLIRLLLPLQALFCVASRSTIGAVAAAVLLILWPISRSVSRRFYAS
jgi:4-hydroxybenzoate polyprenyltransferase